MPSHPVIEVEGLSKSYIIGGQEKARETFREMLTSSLAAPFHRLKRLSGTAAPEEHIWALKDVSFRVDQGEVVGIIGRNGAGKSTLLKILSRITEPTEGRVTIRGRVASLLEVGTGFHPELTGRENIYLNGTILGMNRAEIRKKFDEIVDFSGVEKFLDTPVKRYSSGMQVRLAFAVAAHLEPEILVVDEVLAVGDAEFQRKCLGKMGQVADSGRTVLFVSHNMAAVEKLCGRGVVLNNGLTAFIGSIDSAISAYSEQISTTANDADQHYELLKSIAFFDAETETSTIRMGNGVRLVIEFDTPTMTTRPRVGIVLRRQSSGANVFGVNSDMLPVAVDRAPANRFRAEFEFSGLNLIHGDYLLDVWLGADGQNDEVIEAAIPLHVSEADIYGTGRLPFAHTGAMYTIPSLSISSK